MHSPGRRLLAKLQLAAPSFGAAAERLWSSPRIREIYPAYLGAMHMIVRSAVPLMDAARDRALALGKHDPLGVQLAAYLGRHRDEEAGHDQWLLEDLAATGADPDEPLTGIPSPTIATLVGAQYYWLHHHHPVALLGHIAAIESYPPPPGFAERLQGLTGYPKSAFRAIARHAVLDLRHRREFYDLINELPLTRAHESMIGLSALHTMQVGVDVLLEIHDRVVSRAPAVVAPKSPC
ncbi:long-chain acyl-CoA synthetase [Enhygromyxa salina]|uniref:Long-chain acyl-CoA synthetase n=1 Tax=Enhygromyxa salina TaxID=215803 RepID=A0A0C1ZLG9_9BACT|nr:iron-containing redox enzyme family protein [Enhygromyxa salina]KIG18379.1 long-chain acyl-CoA synthetase [Enhygromyxa salina]